MHVGKLVEQVRRDANRRMPPMPVICPGDTVEVWGEESSASGLLVLQRPAKRRAGVGCLTQSRWYEGYSEWW